MFLVNARLIFLLKPLWSIMVSKHQPKINLFKSLCNTYTYFLFLFGLMHEKPCYQIWYVEKFSEIRVKPYLGGSWPGKSELEQCYSSPPLTWQSLNLFIFSLISCLKILLITFQLTHFSFQKLQLSRGCTIFIIQLSLWVGLIGCFPSYLRLESAVQKLRFGMEMGVENQQFWIFEKKGKLACIIML